MRYQISFIDTPVKNTRVVHNSTCGWEVVIDHISKFNNLKLIRQTLFRLKLDIHSFHPYIINL